MFATINFGVSQHSHTLQPRNV